MSNYKTLENGILYLELDGTQSRYQMGVQHGRALKKQIDACIEYVRQSYRIGLGKRTDSFLDRLLSGTGYLADARRFLPQIYEEMTGIADGCGRAIEDIYMLNCLDEGFYLMLDEIARTAPLQAGEALTPAGKCTCIGIAGDDRRPNMLAQNLDFSEAYDGFQTVFRIHLPEHDFLLYGFCGQLMGMGVNEHGISVIANAVANGRIDLDHGVSNTLMQRAFYECSSIDECYELLRSCPRSTSTAYTIADYNGIRCFEATAGSVVEVPPCKGSTGFAHTNHLLASDDTRDAAGVCEGGRILTTKDGVSFEMTEERLVIAENFVREQCAENGPAEELAEQMKQFLSTPPILRDYGDPTIQSFVSVCDPKGPYIFAAGDKNTRDYVRVDLFT